MYKFEFRLFSLVTLYSFISAITGITFLCYWLYQLLFADALQSLLEEYDALLNGVFTVYMASHNISDIYGSELVALSFYGLEPLAQFCLRTVGTFGPLTGLHYGLSSLRSTPDLINFLNGANDFELLIRDLLVDVSYVSLAQLIRFRSGVAVVNIFIFLLFCITQFRFQYQLFFYTPFESTLVLTTIALTSILILGLFDDTKALFILKTTEEHFQQINDVIAIYEDKRRRGECRQVGMEEIRKWRTLILLARKQAKLACRAIEGAVLSTLVGMNIVITTSIYLFYTAYYKNSPKFIETYSSASMFVCLITSLRLYMKAMLAENITMRESQLAKTLRQLEVNPTDTKFTKAAASSKAIRLELSFLADAIGSKPSNYVLSNLIPLKVSSLFGIFQSIFTYAVALIQFDSVFNSQASAK